MSGGSVGSPGRVARGTPPFLKSEKAVAVLNYLYITKPGKILCFASFFPSFLRSYVHRKCLLT